MKKSELKKVLTIINNGREVIKKKPLKKIPKGSFNHKLNTVIESVTCPIGISLQCKVSNTFVVFPEKFQDALAKKWKTYVDKDCGVAMPELLQTFLNNFNAELLPEFIK